jgi:hypothetical protein
LGKLLDKFRNHLFQEVEKVMTVNSRNEKNLEFINLKIILEILPKKRKRSEKMPLTRNCFPKVTN